MLPSRWSKALAISATWAGVALAQAPGLNGPVVTLRTAGQPERKVMVLKTERLPDGSVLSDVRDLSSGLVYTITDSKPLTATVDPTQVAGVPPQTTQAGLIPATPPSPPGAMPQRPGASQFGTPFPSQIAEKQSLTAGAQAPTPIPEPLVQRPYMPSVLPYPQMASAQKPLPEPVADHALRSAIRPPETRTQKSRAGTETATASYFPWRALATPSAPTHPASNLPQARPRSNDPLLLASAPTPPLSPMARVGTPLSKPQPTSTASKITGFFGRLFGSKETVPTAPMVVSAPAATRLPSGMPASQVIRPTVASAPMPQPAAITPPTAMASAYGTRPTSYFAPEVPPANSQTRPTPASVTASTANPRLILAPSPTNTPATPNHLALPSTASLTAAPVAPASVALQVPTMPVKLPEPVQTAPSSSELPRVEINIPSVSVPEMKAAAREVAIAPAAPAAQPPQPAASSVVASLPPLNPATPSLRLPDVAPAVPVPPLAPVAPASAPVLRPVESIALESVRAVPQSEGAPPSMPALKMPAVSVPSEPVPVSEALTISDSKVAVGVPPSYDIELSPEEHMRRELEMPMKDLLTHVRPSFRMEMATALAEGRYGWREEVKQVLVKVAHTDSAAVVRAHCITLLSRLGYAEAEYVARLHVWSTDVEPSIRRAATEALSRFTQK